MMDKTTYRQKAKNIRKTLDVKNISNKAIYNIKSLSEYKRAKNVMIYYPVNTELNLLDLIDDTKNFYLPRVKNQDIEVCPYKIGDTLMLSKLNIPEPSNYCVDKNILDFVIIPALMADENLYRLGYGGGFYDRFLQNVNTFKLIVVPDELFVKQLPVEDTDIKCDCIITQSVIIQ